MGIKYNPLHQLRYPFQPNLSMIALQDQLLMLVISTYENNNTEKGKNMNIRLKKYLLVGFLVLFFGAANPVEAVTETQIALTTEATNDAIVNLEAALKAVTENKLDEAQNYIDDTRSSASDILGRCSVEAKKERGSNALKNARRQIKNGDSVAAEASLKEAIKIFKSLLMSVNNTEQPSLFK
jgi:flagellin-specific chaperone FliS